MKVIQWKFWVLAGILPKDWISSVFVFPNGGAERLCWKDAAGKWNAWSTGAGCCCRNWAFHRLTCTCGRCWCLSSPHLQLMQSWRYISWGSGSGEGCWCAGEFIWREMWLLFQSRVMSGIQLLFEGHSDLQILCRAGLRSCLGSFMSRAGPKTFHFGLQWPWECPFVIMLRKPITTQLTEIMASENSDTYGYWK